MTGIDFGTFGLFWLLLNLFFLLALVAGGVILSKWITRRRRYKKTKQLEESKKIKTDSREGTVVY